MPVPLLIMLMVKHLVCDFLLQDAYQYLNKGRYGHPGGILHVGYHMMATFVVFQVWAAFVAPEVVASEFEGPLIRTAQYIRLWLILLLAEGLIHYHIDWAKVTICRVYELHASNSEYYWWLLGMDQFLHQLTYVFMALLFVPK